MDTEELLTNAIMGDKTAIQLVAQRLAEPPVPPEPAEQQLARDQFQFSRAIAWAMNEYRDVFGDDARRQKATEIDSRLADERPQMPVQERLRLACDAARAFDADSESNAAAIRSMARLRRRADYIDADDSEDEADELSPSLGDDQRSADIAAMAAGRKAHNLQEHYRAMDQGRRQMAAEYGDQE